MKQFQLISGASEPAPDLSPRPADRILAPPESDASYFTRRAGEERAHANDSADELSRSLHLELAERYEAVAMAIRQVEKQLD